MKNTFFCFITVLLIQFQAYSQASFEQIKQFENNLSPNIQLKDSVLTRFNIEDRMRFRKVPAVSVVVIKDGKIVLAKAYGEADRATHRKADSSTLFQAASISKTLNALCIMKFVEENKLSLTTDFRTYIKDGSFKENKFSKGEKISIAHLLSHSAGIIRDDGPSGDYNATMKLPDITQIVKGEKPALGKGAYSIRKPNETYEYSNQGICITQKILADNFDDDYNRLLTNKVFKPLQMTNSSFALLRTPEEEAKLAKGYQFDYKIVPPWVFPCPSQGGLVATASDIAKAVIAIQNAYTEKDNTFLKKETVQKMFTPPLDTLTHIGELEVPYKNGLGLMLFEKGGQSYFTHAGSIDGYTSVFVGSCDGKNGAVIFLNSSYAGIIPEILNSIATTFYWENYTQYTYKSALKLSDDLLDKYVGSYKQKIKDGDYMRVITKVGNQLFIKGTNDGESEKLYFSTENTAFVLSRGYTVEFISKPNIGINVKNNGNLSGEGVKID